MFAGGCDDSLRLLPTLREMEEIGRLLRKAEDEEETDDPKKKKKRAVRSGCMFDLGDGCQWSDDPSSVPAGANVVLGAIGDLGGAAGPRFVPCERLEGGGKTKGRRFVIGQRMASAGGEFVPGASVRTEGCEETGEEDAFQFLPGVLVGEAFKAGQFVQAKEGEDSLEFVKGQIVHTSKGSKFVEGETIATADGLKFVAG